MHELSIANSIVEIASQHAARVNADRVRVITLRLGALSCVHKSALEFCFDLVTQDTMVEGARLEFIDVPVTIYCASCQHEFQLPGVQSLRCPDCKTPSADIRRGDELDVETIEVTQQTAARV